MKMSFAECAGSFSGLLGALLLSLNTPYSGYGFMAFLVSNLFLIAFAYKNKFRGLFIMQIGFMATSLNGIYNFVI